MKEETKETNWRGGKRDEENKVMIIFYIPYNLKHDAIQRLGLQKYVCLVP